mmetsp:Transcript_19671/g.29186  ORF Transcript_19671/g.29186 Transcript_19671/m.29186 type:complete len:141 (+) Transcript_19671:146-568(+)|eukprot:CAMPEP_0194216586 /NCGR_PEP_ID=MMETSP0156-20130528/19296_1 /TAXON_ID=33649 /ORGANISM="Thalassionema nitzschioides, Strain L26-B" /LENGTH=140 /DNA_ID=CAMNT_0038945387 /DNA_START=77 /DNA_END=499 /DNA_ORIENTATION=+
MKEDYIKDIQKTKDAISMIKKELKPFVSRLDSDDATKKAQAQAVVALSIGTLRYMGARLQGKDEGRKKDDPLRQELDQMRKVIIQIEKKRKAEEKQNKEPANSSKDGATERPGVCKRKKVDAGTTDCVEPNKSSCKKSKK